MTSDYSNISDYQEEQDRLGKKRKQLDSRQLKFSFMTQGLSGQAAISRDDPNCL
jgi:hypothetical protein